MLWIAFYKSIYSFNSCCLNPLMVYVILLDCSSLYVLVDIYIYIYILQPSMRLSSSSSSSSLLSASADVVRCMSSKAETCGCCTVTVWVLWSTKFKLPVVKRTKTFSSAVIFYVRKRHCRSLHNPYVLFYACKDFSTEDRSLALSLMGQTPGCCPTSWTLECCTLPKCAGLLSTVLSSWWRLNPDIREPHFHSVFWLGNFLQTKTLKFLD